MRHDVFRLLDELAAEERGGITTAQVRERFGISEQAASNMMSRLVRDGFLDRVARGSFALRPFGQLGTRAASEDVSLAVGAVFSREPHRLAFRSALDHHGLLVHPVRTVQVALPRRVKLSAISGRRLQPIHEPQETIAIGSEAAGHGARVSGVERALLESAGRPALVGGWATIAGALSSASVDPAALIVLAGRLNAGVALRRLASLAEAQGLGELADRLPSPPPDARLVALDPREPPVNPWTDRRWRVRWPIPPRHGAELAFA